MNPRDSIPDDDLDLLVLVRREHQVDRVLVRRRVLEQRRDVVEEDAGLREVGDLADLLAERLGGHRLETSERVGGWTVVMAE
jgi:hypothetical protein